MTGTDLTILVALAAGVISFLSPCVLPLVPAYLGQLTAIAVASSADGRTPSRWLAMRHALAYVAGFGAVFTLLGVTATFLGRAGPTTSARCAGRRRRPRDLGAEPWPGSSASRRSNGPWRPLEGGGAAVSLARRRPVPDLASRDPGGLGSRSGRPARHPPGLRLAGCLQVGVVRLGAVFAIGWTPCIGIILGGILTMAATSTTASRAGSCWSPSRWASARRSCPRPPSTTVRRRSSGRWSATAAGVAHRRPVGRVIGVAMIFDWLALLPRYFNFYRRSESLTTAATPGIS